MILLVVIRILKNINSLNAERRTTNGEGRLGTASPPKFAGGGGVVQVEEVPAVIEPEKADLGATMIYTHVLNKPGVSVCNPLDQLG